MQSTIAFFEIPTIDFRRAVDFYETILGIRLVVEECPTEKMAFFPAPDGNRCTGAISFSPNFQPSANGILIHLSCEDIERSLDTVIRKGGTIAIPKTRIEASDYRGWFAIFTDTEGNRVGLHSDK